MMPYVKAIAERYKSEVILLHVVKPDYTLPALGMSGPVLVHVSPEAIAEQTKELENFATSELGSVAVRRLLYEGDPEMQIAAFTKEEDVQLVVIPTHGYGVLRRYLIGSVSAKILHDVSCPVLTGAHMDAQGSSGHVKLSNIVCALSLGPHSRGTIALASRVATDFGDKLTIVHVIPAINPGLYVTFSSRLKEEWEEMARRDVEKLRAEVAAHSVCICIQEGDVAHQVCSFAHDIGADLVVIGRGAHDRGLGRLRTNAYAIIRQAPCPVLSV
jgi:nucleotide-binding universal stress UspA family protein